VLRIILIKNAELILILSQLVEIFHAYGKIDKIKIEDLSKIVLMLKTVTNNDLKSVLPVKLYNKIIQTHNCSKSPDGTCIKRHPQQLSITEVNKMNYLVTAKKYSHFSIISLCLYAKRKKLLHCSADTWYRYIHKFNWKRPFNNKKVKIKKKGLRATAPHQIWHVDVSYIKTACGDTYYLQAVLDNYSRVILAWNISSTISAKNTVKLIKEAYKKTMPKNTIELISDSGTENVNYRMHDLLSSRMFPKIIHKLAKRDITKSNSMIERLFHSLKNRYLYYKDLSSKEEIYRLVKFYIQQFNDVMPQKVLSGRTPNEALNGLNGENLINKLKMESREQRHVRKVFNKQNFCVKCVA